jgi:hypothetical protein
MIMPILKKLVVQARTSDFSLSYEAQTLKIESVSDVWHCYDPDTCGYIQLLLFAQNIIGLDGSVSCPRTALSMSIDIDMHTSLLSIVTRLVCVFLFISFVTKLLSSILQFCRWLISVAVAEPDWPPALPMTRFVAKLAYLEANSKNVIKIKG